MAWTAKGSSPSSRTPALAGPAHAHRENAVTRSVSLSTERSSLHNPGPSSREARRGASEGARASYSASSTASSAGGGGAGGAPFAGKKGGDAGGERTPAPAA